jgi:hypothetical protein
MTIVLGEIETLKRLKSELKENGIDRFDSVGSINAFLKSYQSERGRTLRQSSYLRRLLLYKGAFSLGVKHA